MGTVCARVLLAKGSWISGMGLFCSGVALGHGVADTLVCGGISVLLYIFLLDFWSLSGVCPILEMRQCLA